MKRGENSCKYLSFIDFAFKQGDVFTKFVFLLSEQKKTNQTFSAILLTMEFRIINSM